MRFSTLSRALVALAVLTAPVTARAQFTVYTDFAAFIAATSNAGTDSFDDLVAGSLPMSLSRTAGSHTYMVGANTEPLYGAGTSNRWLSTDVATDVITFSGFGSTVRGVGGNFFGTDIGGGLFAGGNLVVRATNASGTTTHNIVGAGLNSFVGFVSTEDILSFTVETVQPQSGDFVWPTVNDFVLAEASASSVVPEPSTFALLFVGTAGMLLVARHRRRV